MKSKDQILLEQAYQKIFEGWHSETNKAMGYDDDFEDYDGVETLQAKKPQSSAENIVDILSKYLKGKDANEDDYIYAGRELRKLGLTGSELDLADLNHAKQLAQYDEPPFDFDVSAILDQIRGPLNYQDDVREL